MKEFFAKAIAGFIDWFDRMTFVVTLIIPVIAVLAAWREAQLVSAVDSPEPLRTYTVVFVGLMVAWWLVLKILNFAIRMMQLVTSGRVDPADLIYNANKQSLGISQMHENGMSAEQIRAEIAQDLEDAKPFNRHFAVFFIGALYLAGLGIASLLT